MKLHKDLANVTVIAAHPFQSQLQLEVSMGGMTWYPLVRPGRDRRRVGAAAASCCPHPPSNCALYDASPAFLFVRRSRGRPSAWSTRGEARHPPIVFIHLFIYLFTYPFLPHSCRLSRPSPSLPIPLPLLLLYGGGGVHVPLPPPPTLPPASSQLHGRRLSHPPFQLRLAPHVSKG
jgi:hypothetical protein